MKKFEVVVQGGIIPMTCNTLYDNNIQNHLGRKTAFFGC